MKGKTLDREDVPIRKTAKGASQGVKGHGVRYVLAFGVAGAAIALAVVTLLVMN